MYSICCKILILIRHLFNHKLRLFQQNHHHHHHHFRQEYKPQRQLKTYFNRQQRPRTHYSTNHLLLLLLLLLHHNKQTTYFLVNNKLRQIILIAQYTLDNSKRLLLKLYMLHFKTKKLKSNSNTYYHQRHLKKFSTSPTSRTRQ